MTNKLLPNKVTKVSKNPEKPSAQRRNFEVIRHFNPLSTACSLYAKIPIINVSDEDETKVVKIQVNPKGNLFSSKRQGLEGRQQRITNHNAEGKKPKPSTLQSSSVSSPKKSINVFKMRSRTFHLSNSTTTLRENKAFKNTIEKSFLKSATSSLKSAAETAQIQRELILQSLKQEILENKKNFPNQRGKLEILNSHKNDSLIKDLKAEILSVKTNNSLQNKMLITELRSEISQYKQFNKFEMYKRHEGSSINQRQNYSADSMKSENLYEGDEVMKNYDSKANSLEKESRKCGLDGSKGASFSGNSKASSRGANAIRPDKDSTTDLRDRSSESTIDPADIPKPPIKMVSDAVSIDNELIKYNVAQTDQLLKRIKKALVKIKSIKPCDEFAPEVKSSSTNTEGTINSSTQGSGEFITEWEGLEHWDVSYQDKDFRDRELKLKSLQCGNKSRCLTCPNSNKSEELNVLKVARPVEIVFTSKPNIEASGSSKNCCDKYRLNRQDMDSERPKTRRIEEEDNLSEQPKNDKFRSNSEMGQLEISSTFQQFHAKLETISETTESNDCTLRKRTDCSQITHQLSDKNCNTEPLPIDNKDTQGATCRDTGISYSCLRMEEEIQVKKVLTADMTTETSSFDLKQTKDTQTTLETQNFKSQQIFPRIWKCSNCNMECLPAIEIMPSKYVCQVCKYTLKHKNLQGEEETSVGSKAEKVKKLKIQILPPIIIKPALTLIQTLNLSIDSIGKSKNHVRNTDNLLFVEIKRLMESQMPLETVLPRRAENNDVTEERAEDVEELNNSFDQDLIKDELKIDAHEEALPANSALGNVNAESSNKINYKIISDIVDDNKSCNDQIKQMVLSTNFTYELCTETEKVVTEETNADEELVNETYHNAEEQSIVKSSNNAQRENEEIHKKRPSYKSYHTYDNTNKHDPGELDQKSSEKPLEVDADFYNTFVNPDLKMCEELTTSISNLNLMGFQSKTVQCDQQMILAAHASCKPEESNKSTIDLLPPRTYDNSSVMDIESKVTVFRGLREVPLKLEASSPEIIHRKFALYGSNLEKNESLSNSQITLPISYGLSSEENRSNGRNIRSTNNATNANVINKLTNSDGEELIASDVESKAKSKILRVKDQKVINKLWGKYRSIELNDSIPNSRITKRGDFSSNSNKSIEMGNEHTIDYWNGLLNKPVAENRYGEHLELGSNGKYMDEKHLFAQMSYSTAISAHKNLANLKCPKLGMLQQKDLQGTHGTFAIVPRHQLRRYSLDISNSDTVTTNSISEGEVLCKHSVSNGEIHTCHRKSQCL
ncbi:uncharacterized protein [Euwallacea fornicatus]|uniref:uncharacterized protein isoform X3 n=1 Tax=Euwallacea fornicatus TaxID=995702 RepID=UPI00338FDB59